MRSEALHPLVRQRQSALVIAAILACAALRLCHIRLLWADEDYHLAAALNMLHGKLPYRDFWYDKPPLNGLFYLLVGAHSGWPLRLLDIAYVLLACYSTYRLARLWWGENEGRIAGLLTAFFLTFYLPSAVISFAADALMIIPHIWAVYFAYTRRPFVAGICCAVAALFNLKAVFVLAVCAVWMPAELLTLLLGFSAPLLPSFALARLSGAWPGFLTQVWQWGLVYAKSSPAAHPLWHGVERTMHWLGFHVALAVGTAIAWPRFDRESRWKLGTWLLLSFAAVCLGGRLDPRYYLQILPPLVIAASRGATLSYSRFGRRAVFVSGLLLAVPLIRFGPRYALLANDAFHGRPTQWGSAALDEDSRNVARFISAHSRRDDSLFVWGYRSDIYVYTRLSTDSLFWDSQPLTGVPADRHFQTAAAIYGGPAAQNRLQFLRSRPTFFVDGLGLINPNLAPQKFPELARWLGQYQVTGRTRVSVIYRRKEAISSSGE